ncbi:inactive serine/threonine-protein kinase VRK3 [Dictyobacter formicarum]|uniref:Protein kinase domain-containing protein n=1 Tax=Dictyobacter formicarum TaxID=2778368 RepID=A0ABQ3VN74_9CHLR|nr:inactive serine/threonine-protein kinase VRK3 [Dictyobacter formicarum]GHO87240.1 hypothetical protein KSZ_52460 [Dictyobacter formicarum]
MSLTHTSLDQTQPEIVRCKRCNAELPPSATFCGQCGERVEKNSGDKSSPKNADITDRYRITSLLRRQHPAKVLLAIDTQQQRPVVIHDIDISALDDEKRAQAIAAVQNEYDVLRHQRIPAVMPLVDLRYFNGHLYVISGWPFALAKKDEADKNSAPQLRVSTLQDILQSGIGLPDEQTAIAWIYRLSRALEQLHRAEILLGQIEPQTILVSQHDYSGEPLLVIAWLPDLLRELIPQPLNHANPSPFCAPEVLLGDVEPRSDVYSLGTILYLLLTGITPDDANKRRHRPLPALRDLDAHSDSALDMVVMQSLAMERELRYQSASEFSETLQRFLPQTITNRSPGPNDTSASNEKNAMSISSHMADNKIDVDNRAADNAEADDLTISMIPLQARMARRYLSRIKTNKLELPEIPTGEAIVEKGSAQQRQFQVDEVANQPTPQNDEKLPADEHIATDESISIEEQPAESESSEPATNQEGASTTKPDDQEQQSTATANPDEQPAEVPPTLDITQMSTVLIKSDSITVALAARAAVADQPADDELTSRTDQAERDDETEHGHKDSSISHLKNLITGSLPSLPKLHIPKTPLLGGDSTGTVEGNPDESLLKRVQRFILGEPQQSTSAAALIETPMRIQPNQGYSIRVNILGRHKDNSDQHSGGLSALGEGETVHIEVRSSLYQNYAYIVQQADVTIPGAGYVAEVTMPMQALSSGPSGRRERLHIFFMDNNRSPLYEKPFVIELFVSHLVQSGREGHNVLSIPL